MTWGHLLKGERATERVSEMRKENQAAGERNSSKGQRFGIPPHEVGGESVCLQRSQRWAGSWTLMYSEPGCFFSPTEEKKDRKTWVVLACSQKLYSQIRTLRL